MAKRKQQEPEENESIGSQMKRKTSSRERNLAIKAKLIEDGKHPEPTLAPGMSQRERNLKIKAELKGDVKTKGKTKGE